MAVAPTERFCSPMSINVITSEVDVTGYMLASGTAKPFSEVVDRIPSVCKVKVNKKTTRNERKKESIIKNNKLKKDISFEKCHQRANQALVHCISLPFAPQLHSLCFPFWIEIF